MILLQELKLAQAVVNRLQTVVFRFCGAVDHALPRLRGALSTGIVATWSVLTFSGKKKMPFNLGKNIMQINQCEKLLMSC